MCLLSLQQPSFTGPMFFLREVKQHIINFNTSASLMMHSFYVSVPWTVNRLSAQSFQFLKKQINKKYKLKKKHPPELKTEANVGAANSAVPA